MPLERLNAKHGLVSSYILDVDRGDCGPVRADPDARVAGDRRVLPHDRDGRIATTFQQTRAGGEGAGPRIDHRASQSREPRRQGLPSGPGCGRVADGTASVRDPGVRGVRSSKLSRNCGFPSTRATGPRPTTRAENLPITGWLRGGAAHPERAIRRPQDNRPVDFASAAGRLLPSELLDPFQPARPQLLAELLIGRERPPSLAPDRSSPIRPDRAHNPPPPRVPTRSAWR